MYFGSALGLTKTNDLKMFEIHLDKIVNQSIQNNTGR